VTYTSGFYTITTINKVPSSDLRCQPHAFGGRLATSLSWWQAASRDSQTYPNIRFLARLEATTASAEGSN